MPELLGREVAELRAKLATLQADQTALVSSRDESSRRYRVMLHMVKELTLNCSQAASASEAAAAKSLLAGELAAAVAQAALAKGLSEFAQPAFEAVQAACEATAYAATSTTQAWTAALVAAGHSADGELLKLSADAGAAAKSAAAAAAQVQRVSQQVRLPARLTER